MARLYIKTPWSYETDSWIDVTSVNFNSKKSMKMMFSSGKIYYIQFFSEVSKDDKYVKSPQTG